MNDSYRRPRKATVQLTSLLDLLFVMIFVSLLQTSLPTKENNKNKVLTSTPPKLAQKKKVKKKALSKATSAPLPIMLPLRARFHFYGIKENPRQANGSYNMQGDFNRKTGRLNLGGVSWIDRPVGYDMVPLAGYIDTKTNTFKGRVEFPGCKVFTLKRVVESSSSNPIAGIWRGTYQCVQGKTGLTLTIQ